MSHKTAVTITFILLVIVAVIFAYLYNIGIFQIGNPISFTNITKQGNYYSYENVIGFQKKDTWDRQTISYDANEIKDFLLKSEKDFSSQGDPLPLKTTIAEKCSAPISKYIYAFPGFHYDNIISRIGLRAAPQRYPALIEGNLYVLLEATGGQNDINKEKLFLPNNFIDSYRFELNYNDLNKSCQLVQFVGVSRGSLPTEAKRIALGIALTNAQLQTNLKVGRHILGFSPWIDENTLDRSIGISSEEKTILQKFKKPFIAIIPIRFEREDNMGFTAYVDIVNGSTVVTPQQKIMRPILLNQ